VLLGVFFAIPLYLQVVQGFDAFQTGLRLLPVSLTMLVASMCGPLLGRFASPRRVVQVGLAVLFGAILSLVSTIDPEIDDAAFAVAMALLGLGMGLLASQLGNVVQSSVGESARSEVGGLQYTAQNLGSSLGTAFIGAIVIGGLAAAVGAGIGSDPRVSEQARKQIGVKLEAGISFLSVDQVRTAAGKAGLPPAEADAVVETYAGAQLVALKAALLTAGAITLASFGFTQQLPATRLAAAEPESEPAPTAASIAEQ